MVSLVWQMPGVSQAMAFNCDEEIQKKSLRK
jgi:hypothetical protein